MKSLAAKFSALAFLAAANAYGGVIDETGPGAPMGAPGVGMGAPMAGGASLGAGENRAMRTVVSLNAVQAAFDNSDPRESVQRFRFDPQMTYKLRLREFMASMVVLPRGEAIDGYSLGDTKNFTFTPYSKEKKGKNDDVDRLDNVFSVQPTYPGADTSLTVLGRTGRVYSFYLRADSVKSPHVPHLVVYIDDAAMGAALAPPLGGGAVGVGANAPQSKPAAEGPAPADKGEKMTGEDAAAIAEYLRSLPLVDPKAVNLNRYKVAGGDKALSPIRVFDDGYWTYFQFSKEGNLDKARVPAIYRVIDGYDTPANIRVEGGTIIAESIATGWTLRSGEAHLCIRAK